MQEWHGERCAPRVCVCTAGRLSHCACRRRARCGLAREPERAARASCVLDLHLVWACGWHRHGHTSCVHSGRDACGCAYTRVTRGAVRPAGVCIAERADGCVNAHVGVRGAISHVGEPERA
eukprot:2786425-Prymnesium_polylepis.1